jgi:hypothetical protein
MNACAGYCHSLQINIGVLNKPQNIYDKNFFAGGILQAEGPFPGGVEERGPEGSRKEAGPREGPLRKNRGHP